MASSAPSARGGTLAGIAIALKFSNSVRIALAPRSIAISASTGTLKSEGSSMTEGIGQLHH